jgi:hypothetical protein
MLSFKIDKRTARGQLVKALKNETTINLGKGYIQSDGLCSSCKGSKETFSEEPVKCAKCKSCHHSACLTKPLSADFLNHLLTDPCTWWLCPPCVTSSDDANEADDDRKDVSPDSQVDFISKLEDFKVQLLKSVNDSFDHKLKCVSDSLTDKMNAVFDKCPSSTDNSTYSAKAQQDPIQLEAPKSPVSSSGSAEVLILSPADTTPHSEVKDVAMKVSKNLEEVAVAFLKVHEGSGKVIIGFPNKLEKEKGEKLLKNIDQFTNNKYSMKSTDKMLPKLTVRNVSTDIIGHIDISDPKKVETRNAIKKCIRNSIMQKNRAVKNLEEKGHTLEIVYIEHLDNGRSLTLGIKVSPAIRFALMNDQGGRIFIGNQVHPFHDRYFYKVCYHCQSIGHFTKECPNIDDAPYCFYCSGRHRSKECTNKTKMAKMNCINCFKSSNTSIRADSYTHNAASHECPITIREVRRLENNTELVSLNVL